MLYCEVIQDLEDKLKQSEDKNSILEHEKGVLESEKSALKDENSVLKGQVERLKKVEKKFEKFKVKQKLTVSELRKALKKVKKELEEFKVKNRFTVGELRKALKIKPDKKQRSKRRGAPKGHKGASFKIPEATAEKKHSLEECPHCNSKLGEGTHGTRVRYITDIEPVNPVVTTKHVIPRKYCHSCEKLVEPVITEALPRARIGLNLMTWVFYMRIAQRSSFKQIEDYLKTHFNFKVTEVGLVGVLNQLTRAFGTYEKYLVRLLKMSKIKYTDSTGWRVAGKNYYAWILLSKAAALYKVFKRNNHKGPLRLLGKKQQDKILVTDRYSACTKLAQEANMQSQYCIAHILQDSKELAQHYTEGEYVHKTLKKIYKNAKTLEQNYHSKVLNDIQAEKAVKNLKERITALTKQHYKSSRVRKFLKNLHERDLNKLFLFITTDADSTNNCSERALRPLVITRHISHGSNTLKGANTTMTLHSVYQTLKLQTNNFQNTNIHTELKKILKPTTQN